MKNLISAGLVRFAMMALIGAVFGLRPGVSSAHSAEPVFITLGTGGGPAIRSERSRPANAIIVNGATYLFDIGAGTQQQMARAKIDPASVQAIFLSHHHIDHVADLGPYLVNRWLLYSDDRLPVIGPPGTVEMVHGIVQSARPVELAPVTINGLAKPALSTTVVAQNLNSSIGIPELVYSDDNIRVLAITNDHYHFAEGSEEDIFSRSYSFRIETNTKSYVYTGDTGWSQNVIDLARNADVLVSEVIDLVGIERTLRASPNIPVAALPGLLAHMAQDHLTPQQVGEMAKAAGVKSVVLTHLVPGNDGETDPGVYSAQVSEIFAGPVRVANDLDAF